MRIARGALIPLVLLILWEAFSRAGTLPIDTLSRPSAIFRAGVVALSDGTLVLATWETLEAALVGLAVATILGIFFGVIFGLSPRMERVVGPSIDALRPIPPVALIPLTLLMFGFGMKMEASVVAFSCLWPILLVTIAAVRGIEPRLLEVGEALEMSFQAKMWTLVLPAALGRINVGVRIAAGVALVVAVTVEIVLNPRGLGYSMIIAQQSFHPDLMYAELLWLGLLGYGLNLGLKNATGLWRGGLAMARPT